MKLYGSYTSPFVRHCRTVLLETGLPYEFVETAAGSSVNKSPTKKVPYLEDGDLKLSDSSSIVMHLRQKAGSPFLAEVADYDLYCLVNTLLDTGINVFLFERLDGLLPQNSKYLQRQVARLESGLAELERRPLPSEPPLNDDAIRLACFLDWGLFRKRFTFDEYPKLTAFYELARSWEPFAKTAPPQDAPPPGS